MVIAGDHEGFAAVVRQPRGVHPRQRQAVDGFNATRATPGRTENAELLQVHECLFQAFSPRDGLVVQIQPACHHRPAPRVVEPGQCVTGGTQCLQARRTVA